MNEFVNELTNIQWQISQTMIFDVDSSLAKQFHIVQIILI